MEVKYYTRTKHFRNQGTEDQEIRQIMHLNYWITLNKEFPRKFEEHQHEEIQVLKQLWKNATGFISLQWNSKNVDSINYFKIRINIYITYIEKHYVF